MRRERARENEDRVTPGLRRKWLAAAVGGAENER